MKATLSNMEKHYQPGVYAYSPYTGEMYSANPRDYFLMDDPEEFLVDGDGNAMLLATREERMVEL